MNKQTRSLEYIKRQAKKIKIELNISHTQALQLMAKKNGYSNWIHCQRILSKDHINEVPAVEEVEKLSFTNWLKKQKNRDSPLGDLAIDMLKCKDWPSYNNLEDYRSYIILKKIPYGAVPALERAWKSYKLFLKRKSLPQSNLKKLNRTILNKFKPRKIVFVNNITPLHYTKRKAEKFNLGDLAWISFDGRKALPVIIVEADDRHYTFKMERPLKKSGDQHYLFLDEVRSTPELACTNHVTN